MSWVMIQTLIFAAWGFSLIATIYGLDNIQDYSKEDETNECL
jgi:hypothetical protein